MSLAFMNPDINTGLVFEHTTIELMVVQKFYEKNTLLVFLENEDIENYVIHCDPFGSGWVIVSILDVMLP